MQLFVSVMAAAILSVGVSVSWWADAATVTPNSGVAAIQPSVFSTLHLWRELEAQARERILIRQPSISSALHLWRELEVLARERIVIRRRSMKHALRPRTERLSCKLGTEDRHARIAVELTAGRVKSIAYYSKWKPRTCSVHIFRDDSWSVWKDTGHTTLVTLNEEKGAFLIDHQSRYVKFLFRDIDRERFCGMDGKITGSLTVSRGSSRCILEGVMDEN